MQAVGVVIEFEPAFGSSIGAWNTAEWAAYRERVEREMDSPESVGAAGGEIRVGWRRDNGDWDRVGADPDLLLPLIAGYGPTRFGGALMRTEDADVRLLRALSVVSGWDLPWMWQQLLSRLELALGRAKTADAESEEKTGVKGRRLRAVREAGICADEIWTAALAEWWEAAGRDGRWQRELVGASALAWTEIPEEACVGPCVVRWLDARTYRWSYSAMVNGEIRDVDRAAYSGLTFFFHVLNMG